MSMVFCTLLCSIVNSQFKQKYQAMHLLFWIFFASVYTKIELAVSEAFSSTANLIDLVEGEKGVLAVLYQYVSEDEKRINEMYSIIEDIESAIDYVEKYNSSLLYVGHPVNAYNLVKRWSKLSQLCTADSRYKELAENLEKLQPVSQSDFYGANISILRLQRVFNLSAELVASGNIYGQKAVHEMLPDDCLALGETALKTKEFDLAVEWLRLAEPGLNTTEHKQRCWTALSTALEKMGNMNEAYRYGEAALNLVPADLNITAEVDRLQNLKTGEQLTTPWSRIVSNDIENYEKLCRGEPDSTSDPEVAKDLLCYYKKGLIPYVQYKHEVLSWSPRIGMFYDVISDKDTEIIIEKAYPSLNRSLIVFTDEDKESRTRVSKTTWLWDTDSFVKRLSDQVEDITGLETTQRLDGISSSDAFQVVNYGIGGHYEPHVDFFQNPYVANASAYIHDTGDRLATLLIYMTDVRAGGATVFPRANITVTPVKNAAAFWYNANLSGDFDGNTVHAGCPQLLGQKWVINKWIREYGQEFRRRCGLHRDAVDKSIE